MKKYLLFAILLCVWISCRDDRTVSDMGFETLKIRVKEAVPFDGELRAERTFVLEVKNDLFPGMVQGMSVVNDTVYILDAFKAKGLYVYDKNGTFLYAYDRIGQGVGEFMDLKGFQVGDSSVYLLDSSCKQILIIDKKGKYISTQKLPDNDYISSFAVEKGGGLWIDRGNSGGMDGISKLLYQKINNDVAMTVLPVFEELKGKTISPLNSFAVYGSAIHYLPALENVIYDCKEGVAEVIYKLDFAGDWPTKSFFERNRDAHPLTLFRKIEESGYITGLNFLEDASYLVLNFHHDGSHYLYVYDKNMKRQKLYRDEARCLYQPVCLVSGRLYVAQESEDSFVIHIYDLSSCVTARV